MLQEMNDELQRQEAVLDAVTDHTDRTNFEIQNVASQARRDFKVRPKRARPARLSLYCHAACVYRPVTTHALHHPGMRGRGSITCCKWEQSLTSFCAVWGAAAGGGIKKQVLRAATKFV
jgi:hypothetical protein